ncbi:MAG: hypothetical protein JNN20_03450 [Betaproteobacteria bacterium]|nr:hypothetical protein [Betaproteobacteria bacterium]
MQIGDESPYRPVGGNAADDQGRKTMAVAVVVSFDLHKKSYPVPKTVYNRIKADLARIKVEKFVLNRDKDVVKLPANTFVGILSGPLSKRKSATIRDAVREEVAEIIAAHHKRATIFVFVGKKWAWGKKSLRRR